jgi:alkaline phosphatase D
MLMIGDQIYADDLRFFGKDVTVDDFLERYRLVFSQPGIRALMARVPTYMILDDHEIEDNWPSRATSKDRLTMYPHAVHAYQIYQCSHSPVFDTKRSGGLSGTLQHFWYQFSDGCTDWFVLDVRTERSLGKKGLTIISEVQMNALFAWLADKSGKIKFIVSSVPFIPDLNNDGDDKWGAFLTQRDKVIAHIAAHDIPKVVFVSGDVHSSFTCELEAVELPQFKIHQIVSSSFFWPYPHMGENDFAFGAELKSSYTGKYLVRLTSEVHSEDNFARIDAETEQIHVTFYSRKGELLGKPSVLKLT